MQTEHGKWLWVAVSVLAFVSFSSCLEKEQPSTEYESAVATGPGEEVKKQPSGGSRVAVVNGSVITREDIDRDMGNIRERFARMGKSLTGSQLSDARKEVLENLINRELLYQESQKRGIRVDEATVKEHMEKLAKQFPNEAEFKTLLKKMNLSEAGMAAQIKQGLAIHQFIDDEFVNKAVVSEEDIKTYFNSHQELFNKPEMVQASHILIKVDPQADDPKRAEARKKLIEVRKELEQGADFTDLAKKFSQCPSSAKGGDLGYFKRGQMVKPFEEVAFALEPGEVSDIVETGFGFHLIKAGNKKPAITATYEEVKDKIERYLKQKKAEEEIGQYAEKLKEKAEVEVFPPEDLH